MGSHQRQHQLNGVGDLQAYDMNPISSCLHRGYLVIRRIGYLPTFKSSFHGVVGLFKVFCYSLAVVLIYSPTNIHPLPSPDEQDDDCVM